MLEELAAVLSKNASWEFESFFDIGYAGLRVKGSANGREELLRLRAHEKLQAFLHTGIVTKNGKEYTGVPKALVNYFKTTAELKVRMDEVRQSRSALQSKVSEKIPPGGANAAKAKLPVRIAPAQVR